MLGRIRVFLTQIDIKTTTRSLIIPFSFILPTLMLYALDPNSFELVWKGRGPLLLFLWLLLLELALGWKKLLNRRIAWTWFRIAAVIVTASAPTTYVISAFFLEMNHPIMELGKLVGVPYQMYPEMPLLEWHWPLSFEFLFFTAFFVASVWLTYEIDGLKRFSISLFFLGATSFFYMIDTFYPYGNIVVLQAFAPITASSAVHILNWMGYGVRLASFQINSMSVLIVPGLPLLAIGWPSSGAHSLIIYTFMILLFLKDATFSLVRKIIYIAIGAIGTFIVNVLRVVTICIIGVNVGEEAMNLFHSYYGELFFISWALSYSIIIIYSSKIWAKLSILRKKLVETGRKLLFKIHSAREKPPIIE